MRAVVTRVRSASVTVEGRVVGSTGGGLLVLLGVGQGDGEAERKKLTEKLPVLRIFEDEAGNPIPLSDLMEEGKEGLWLIFWASWCPDCENQLRYIAEMEALAEQYHVKLVLERVSSGSS